MSNFPDLGNHPPFIIAPALERLLPMREVSRVTSLSKATILREIARQKFPRAIELTRGRVAWRSSEIARWLAERQVAA